MVSFHRYIIGTVKLGLLLFPLRKIVVQSCLQHHCQLFSYQLIGVTTLACTIDLPVGSIA